MILIMLILIIIIYIGQTKDNNRERFLKLFLYHLSITIRFLLKQTNDYFTLYIGYIDD